MRLLQLFVLACLSVLGSALPAQVLAEGNHFEVTAETLLDARRVLARAEEAGRRLQALLGPIPEQETVDAGLPDPLPVRIRIEDSVDLAAPEVIWGDGRRQLVCPMDAALFRDEPTFLFRITKGWLARWVWQALGAEQIPDIPHWLIVALSMDTLAATYPALPTAWGETLTTAHRFTLSDLVLMTPDISREQAGARIQCWLLLHTLRLAAPSGSARADMIHNLLRGRLPDAFVAEYILGDFDLGPTLLEAWWQVTVEDFVWEPERSALSIHLSRFEIERLASWWSAEGGLPVWFSAEQLVDRWESWGRGEARREAVESRVLAVKLMLPEVNPVYVNALISLGQTYEYLLDDALDAANESWAQFSLDWAFAREVGMAAERAQQAAEAAASRRLTK